MINRVVLIAVLLACVHGDHLHKSDAWLNKDGQQLEGIVGGKPTTIRKHPHQVFIYISDSSSLYACGGSIISSKFILTAAHCLQGKILNVLVRAGSDRSDSGGIVIPAKKYLYHKKYNSTTSDYDVAIIRLPYSLPLNNLTMRAVQLTNWTVKEGTPVTVSGWGRTAECGEPAKILREITVPVISTDKCQKLYRGHYTITPCMICAGLLRGKKDTCQGDSGGALVIPNKQIQVGIVSHGLGCARPHWPGVYTNVAAVRDWIRRVSGI